MVRQDIVGYKEWMTKEKLSELVRNRDAFVWGSFVQGKYVAEWLEENNIHVAGYIDSFRNGEYNGKKVYTLDDFSDTGGMYIFIAINGIRSEIINMLNQKGFKQGTDYTYIFHRYDVVPFSGFRDVYGNEIIVNSVCPNLKVSIQGYGSKVYIGKNVTIEGLNIELGSNSEIIIDDGCSFGKECSMFLKNRSSFVCGRRNVFGDETNITIYHQIKIGNNNNLGSNGYFISNVNAPIEIGDDCLFAHNNELRSGDGHTIIDLRQKCATHETRERFVRLDDHVWLTSNVMVLWPSHIGSSTVIGANSLVKGNIPANSVAIGTPAKVVREYIDWLDEDGVTYDEYNGGI